MPLHDATEYQFSTDHHNVRVRAAHDGSAPIDLTTVGSQYAEYLKTFMGATDATVSPVTTTAKGAQAVTITATIPEPKGPPEVAGTILRTALLRFGSGPVVELSLSASESGPAAEAEFHRLLDTATPADTQSSVAAVAQAFSAGPTGRTDHPAGPIKLALTPDYATPTSFTLAASEDGTKFRLEAASATEEWTKAAVSGTILGRGVTVGRNERGQPMRYEATTLRPRRSARGATTEAVAADALRGASPAGAAGETVVEGVVHGAPVRVRVSGGRAGWTEDRCHELIQALNAAK